MQTETSSGSLIKLDFGCGPNPREGFEGVDRLQFGQKHILDVVRRIRVKDKVEFARWWWPDGSVEEAHTSHFVEHLTGWERVHFVNELYRVLVPGGKCTVIVPHWCSNRAYGDPSHAWPPVSEMWFYYLSRDWRLGGSKPCPCKGTRSCAACGGSGTVLVPANAPHTDIKYEPRGFSCNFIATWGYVLHPETSLRSQEAQQFQLQYYKEAAQDIVATLTKQ